MARRAAGCGWPIAAASAASDPLWYRGRLFVLTIGPAGEQFASPLCLVELHPETGDVLSRQQILETAEREQLPCECQASWAGNRLVVLVAGSVICDRPARAGRLAPPGNDSALRSRPRLRSAVLPAGDRIRRAALRPAAGKLRDRLPRPGDGPAPLAARHPRLASASSICPTTASWRGPRGDSSP